MCNGKVNGSPDLTIAFLNNRNKINYWAVRDDETESNHIYIKFTIRQENNNATDQKQNKYAKFDKNVRKCRKICIRKLQKANIIDQLGNITLRLQIELTTMAFPCCKCKNTSEFGNNGRIKSKWEDIWSGQFGRDNKNNKIRDQNKTTQTIQTRKCQSKKTNH